MFSKLASEYVTTETSLEGDLMLVYLLYQFHLTNLAKETLSRSKYRQLPDGEVKLLRLLSTRSSICELVSKHHFNVDDADELDYSNTELIEKLLFSGNCEYFWDYLNCNRGSHALVKIGETVARCIVFASRRPDKYAQISARIDLYFRLLLKVIQELNQSSDNDSGNRIVATVGGAFADEGDFLDLMTRCYISTYYSHYDMHYDFEWHLVPVLFKREIGLRYAFKYFMGDRNYCNCAEVRSYSDSGILADIRHLFAVQLWKRLVFHVAKQISDQATSMS